MYTLNTGRAFEARHYLVGGDWGPENDPHVHAYRVEVRLESEELDQHGYIVDLEKLEDLLERSVDHYRHRMLNDLPEFAGRNPSIEHFCRCFFDRLAAGLRPHRFHAIEVRIWETADAWASYRERFR
ncbi:MAG: 6-carboxytetrahydropterin synthase [Desulfobacterales bacterium]|nr:6-carboxytetrahydropterin synthase [Desulfobacterales bacterium]